MKREYLNIVLAYCIAGIIAVLFGTLVRHWHPLLLVALADLVGTVVIFGFSVYYDNSSIYDAYWSVAPILISSYWIFITSANPGSWVRRTIVVVLVLCWAFRLTLNWAVRWQGKGHEDWRYVEIRVKYSGRYWLISFLGIHMMPTILVFLGCLSLLPAIKSQTAFGGLDLLATLVTAGAIWIEAQADKEVDRFGLKKDSNEKLFQSGLWSYSRHPNYFGEIMFWWGLFLFAYSANPAYWWAVIGPVSITLLFIFISIPIIEKRMLVRKPEYSSYVKTTSVLIPWPRRNKRHG